MNDQLIPMKLHINFIKNIQPTEMRLAILCVMLLCPYKLRWQFILVSVDSLSLPPPPTKLICNPFIILEVLLFLAKNINKKDKSKYI